MSPVLHTNPGPHRSRSVNCCPRLGCCSQTVSSHTPGMRQSCLSVHSYLPILQGPLKGYPPKHKPKEKEEEREGEEEEEEEFRRKRRKGGEGRGRRRGQLRLGSPEESQSRQLAGSSTRATPRMDLILESLNSPPWLVRDTCKRKVGGWGWSGATMQDKARGTGVIRHLHWARHFQLRNVCHGHIFSPHLTLPFLASPSFYSFLFPRPEIFQEASMLTPEERVKLLGISLLVMKVFQGCSDTHFVCKSVVMSQAILVKPQLLSFIWYFLSK